MKISGKFYEKFDLFIFLPVLVLLIFGLLAIYSSTINHPIAAGNFQKQLFWAIISILVLFVTYLIPTQLFRFLSIPSYLTALALLVLVLFLGKSVYGAKSWINFGSVGFQPSEFAKISLIFFLSYWFHTRRGDINNIKDIGIALMIGFIPVFLILLEPDMGTAVIFIVITFAMIFWSGISLFGLFVVLSPGFTIFASMFGEGYFFGSLLVILAVLFVFKRNLFVSASIFVMNLSAGFILDYAVKFLQPHQQKRIETFIDPMADPLGAGYNALQARLAIGSGGLTGKGFMEGNQTQLRFIPEQWTDFIYCVIGEEFGFIGSILVLSLFLILFFRLLKIASSIRHTFRSGLIMGTLTLLFCHFIINIGMNVGIMPVIGVPLPFLSYGGSSLVVNMFLMGVAMNISKNRKL